MIPLRQRLLNWADEIEQDQSFNPPTNDAITADLREAAHQLSSEALHQILLDWRNIEDPCPICAGSGIRTYPNTATYHRASIAGQALTDDVCDRCWGSGDATHPWPTRK